MSIFFFFIIGIICGLSWRWRPDNKTLSTFPSLTFFHSSLSQGALRENAKWKAFERVKFYLLINSWNCLEDWLLAYPLMNSIFILFIYLLFFFIILSNVYIFIAVYLMFRKNRLFSKVTDVFSSIIFYNISMNVTVFLMVTRVSYFLWLVTESMILG